MTDDSSIRNDTKSPSGVGTEIRAPAPRATAPSAGALATMRSSTA
ncbi:MAG TPA: hypothetical protein VK860_07835 [Ilumatobacteraceae bacterium]|nr:hypothetical protein [Ilumatobacteraceae bacterium]